MTADPLAFLNALSAHTQAQTEHRTARLGTVDPAYTSGQPRITFDGESTLSVKGYPYAGYTPVAGDRVVLIPVGNSYLIIGAVGLIDSKVLISLLTGKGDLIGATASATPARVPTGTVDGQLLTRSAAAGTGMTWALPSDATTGSKGVVQLAGDLAGTAAAPTVPGLAGKANTSHSHAASDTTSGTFDGNRIGDYSVQDGPSLFRHFWDGSLHFVRNDTDTVVKTFVIDHPNDPRRYLVHGCTESPNNGVEYWGVATLDGGQAVVHLPEYFEDLVAETGRVVLLTPVATDGGSTAVPTVAATYPRDGQFWIVSTGWSGSCDVSWLVKAIRKDVPALTVEPLRADVTVVGDGPYRYIVRAKVSR